MANYVLEYTGPQVDTRLGTTIPTDISDLTDTNRVIPVVPETVSSFTNDAGYLTSYTETDPTVPSWAKAVSKPSYTASEVGALPSSTTYVASFNGSTGDVTYTAPVTSVNSATGSVVVDKLKTTAGENNTEYNLIGTAVSNNNNSAVNIYQQSLLSVSKSTNFARLTIGSTSIPGDIRIYSNVSSASGFTDLKSGASSTNERTVTFPDASGTVALTSDIPNVPSWALASNKPSYTASEVGAVTSSDVATMISQAVSSSGGFSIQVVQSLPAAGTTGTFYFVPNSGNGDNIYDEYLYVNNNWEKIGTNGIDLTGYVPTSRTINGKALTTNISLTASDVSALPSSTTYVSSFNGSAGAITYTAPVTSVNGQTGVVTISLPTKVSDLNNDLGYLTLSTLPKYDGTVV